MHVLCATHQAGGTRWRVHQLVIVGGVHSGTNISFGLQLCKLQAGICPFTASMRPCSVVPPDPPWRTGTRAIISINGTCKQEHHVTR
jgi:hypothetical protein